MLVTPVLGLAVDGAVVFWEKARLPATLAAAAIAAGRFLHVGQTLASQAANATQAAVNVFNVNFMPGNMNTTVDWGRPTVAICPTATTLRTVKVTATVHSPLYFLNVLGVSSSTASAYGQASRRDVNIILVLDRSGSMAGTPCSAMISSAETFVKMFVGGHDELGLVTVNNTANPHDCDPTLIFKWQSLSLTSVIRTLVCSGTTNSAEGLNVADQQIKDGNNVGALNVILFFSRQLPHRTHVSNESLWSSGWHPAYARHHGRRYLSRHYRPALRLKLERLRLLRSLLHAES